MSSTPAGNYKSLLKEIAVIATQCGRDPNEITLVAVSKEHTWLEASAIFEAGCRDFGENRLQEALPKIALAPQEITWHMIGTLQGNKVAKAIDTFAWIHSVDTVELAQKIAKESEKKGKRTRILLQANTSGELSKHGLAADEWVRSFHLISKLPGLDIQGLMTIAPFVEDEAIVRGCFARLRQLKDILEKEGGVSLPHLSMGMTHDYHWAIAEGASFLRIGTALFRK